jgi:hypothetical protein
LSCVVKTSLRLPSAAANSPMMTKPARISPPLALSFSSILPSQQVRLALKPIQCAQATATDSQRDRTGVRN